ncbi:hypothetical protein DFH07DRAFT_820124 [Mycena maculata]|uniref:Uncharacterized protein n=1 Tax=Mycena maculata TaxID=230809 RepID=A0AAD7J8K6_9AGAR|nr:hypothetical protein DFH07DRAFT_820124 [Mycena maculata]
MRPSPACMARKIPKPLQPKMQVFPRTDVPADSKPSIPRLVSRKKIALQASILPAPVPRNHKIKPPTLSEGLLAEKLAAGDKWPPNLRIEPFITREKWAPVQKGLRSKLKRMLREE